MVPDDILLQTHIGAHKTMWDIIGKNKIPKELQGGIYVILNNRENTVFWSDNTGKPVKGSRADNFVVKDFKYLTFKEPGKSPVSDAKIKLQLYSWVVNNVPLTKDGVFEDD